MWIVTRSPYLLLMLCVVAGCGRSGAVGTQASGGSAAKMYVFHDRLDSMYEWVIVIDGPRTFLQKAVFPGYGDRKWYELKEDFSGAAACKAVGELKPPFVPGGPNLARRTFAGGAEEDAYFRDDNSVMRGFVKAAEAAASKTEPLKELPEWVMSHKGVLLQLGEEVTRK